MGMEKENITKRKIGSTHIILIIVIILLMLLVGGLLWYFTHQPEDTKKGALVVDESNLAEVQEMFADPVDDGLFEVNMNTVWRFADGNTASYNAYLANGAANSLPLSFEIMVGEEIIYTSTLIPVGNQIKEIVLDSDLEAGTYYAVCQYHLWNEDNTENSSFGINITLVIEN